MKTEIIEHWLSTSLDDICKDNTASASADLIKFAYKKNILVVMERDFLLDVSRKHNLSEKQKNWKIVLNKKIIAECTR